MKVYFKTLVYNPFPKNDDDFELLDLATDRHFEIYNESYYRDAGFIRGMVDLYIDDGLFVNHIYTDNIHLTWLSYLKSVLGEMHPKKSFIAYDGEMVSTYLERDSNGENLRLIYGNHKTTWIPSNQLKQAIVKGFMEFMSHTNRDVESLKYMDQEDDDEITEEILEANEIYEKMLSDSKKGKPLY